MEKMGDKTGMNFMEILEKVNRIEDNYGKMQDKQDKTDEKVNKLQIVMERFAVFSETFATNQKEHSEKLSEYISNSNSIMEKFSEQIIKIEKDCSEKAHATEIEIKDVKNKIEIENLKQDKSYAEKKLSFWEKHTDKFIGGLITAILIPAVIFILKNASAFMATVK